jgi:RNA-binding protein
MTLSKKQLKTLKTLSHNLKPVVTAGQNGLTENVLNEIELALDFHELVKIKLAAGDRDDREEMIRLIFQKTGAEKIQSIGKTLTLFRRNAKKPKIDLPR